MNFKSQISVGEMTSDEIVGTLLLGLSLLSSYSIFWTKLLPQKVGAFDAIKTVKKNNQQFYRPNETQNT